MKIAKVVWMDAHFQEGDSKTDDLNHEPYETVSVGILVRKNAIGITLAQSSWTKDKDHAGETLFIPAGMITSVQLLKGEA